MRRAGRCASAADAAQPRARATPTGRRRAIASSTSRRPRRHSPASISARASRSRTSTVWSGALRRSRRRPPGAVGRERREAAGGRIVARRRAAPAGARQSGPVGPRAEVAGERACWARGIGVAVLGARRPRAARRAAARPSRRPTGSGRRGRAPCPSRAAGRASRSCWNSGAASAGGRRRRVGALVAPELDAQHRQRAADRVDVGGDRRARRRRPRAPGSRRCRRSGCPGRRCGARRRGR